MASNLKTQAMLDFEEATEANDVVRGAESKLLNLMLYSAAQVDKLMFIGDIDLMLFVILTQTSSSVVQKAMLKSIWIIKHPNQ